MSYFVEDCKKKDCIDYEDASKCLKHARIDTGKECDKGLICEECKIKGTPIKFAELS